MVLLHPKKITERHKRTVPLCPPPAKNIYKNRDKITVSWLVLPSGKQCRQVEAKWISKFDPEWNCHKGWGKQ